MSRCKACNRPFNTIELKRKKADGSAEDLCSICLRNVIIPTTFDREMEDEGLMRKVDLEYLNEE